MTLLQHCLRQFFYTGAVVSIEPGKLLMGRTEIYTGRLAKALLGARKHCVRRSDVITIVKLLRSLCFRIFFYLIFVVSGE